MFLDPFCLAGRDARPSGSDLETADWHVTADERGEYLAEEVAQYWYRKEATKAHQARYLASRPSWSDIGALILRRSVESYGTRSGTVPERHGLCATGRSSLSCSCLPRNTLS